MAEEVPRDEQRDDDDAERHRDDGVGLHDVAHHLVGVNQVIDGDEVVADAEFVPEKEFADAVEDDGAHVKDDEEREPHGSPVVAESFGQEKPQGETAGPVSQDVHGDPGRDASVFVEDRVEKRDVAECRGEQPEDDPSPRLRVLGARDAQHEEPQEDETHGRGAEVVHGAEQEYFTPFAEREAQRGRLGVEKKYDTQRETYGHRQQGELEVEAGDQPNAFLHDRLSVSAAKLTIFGYFRQKRRQPFWGCLLDLV